MVQTEKGYYWPEKGDRSTEPVDQIIKKLEPPIPVKGSTNTRMLYQF
jgi:hypothetical protein